MTRYQVALYRQCLVDQFIKADAEGEIDWGDLLQKCGVRKVEDLIPSLDLLEKEMAPIEDRDSYEAISKVFYLTIRNIAEKLGLGGEEAEGFAAEVLAREQPNIILQLSNEDLL